MSEGAWPRSAAARPVTPAVVLPVPVEPSAAPAAPAERDVAALAYAADAEKKGLARILAAWAQARRPGETLLVAGQPVGPLGDGAEGTGLLAPDDYRALLRRARIFVAAPRHEDYGIAQLEALADGCRLVSTPAVGPYPALALARALDARSSTTTSRPRSASRSTRPPTTTPSAPPSCSRPTAARRSRRP